MSDDNFFDELAEEPREGPTGNTRPRKRLRDRWLLLTLIGFVVVALVAAGGIVAWYTKAVVDGLNSMERNPTLMPDPDDRAAPQPDPVPTAEGRSHAPLNMVLIGSDERSPDEDGRSDVLMVMHLPGDREGVYLISLPRDYWVDIPGHGTAKINAAHAWGGTALTVETVEQLLNVPVEHTATIDFEGFVRVIDAIGGVTVHNRHASGSDGYTFPEGPVDLTGDSALVFVRERKNLPGGDLDRAERQRDVIRAIIDKLTSRGVLTNPGTFRDAITSLAPNFTVDSGLDNDRIVDIGRSMRIGGGEDVHSLQAPVAGHGTSSDGQAYLQVDEAKLAELAKALRNDTMAEYAKQ